jgi:hypothetical protein
MQDSKLKLKDLRGLVSGSCNTHTCCACMSVGVMLDSKLKLKDLHASHTLGCVGDWDT